MATTKATFSILLQHNREITRLFYLSFFSLILLIVAYFALVRSGTSYTAIWLNDEMALTAASYRVYRGQLPSVDFYSVYGALVYFPTALGFALGLKASVVLAFGQIVVASFLLCAAALICFSRFSLLPACIFLLFLFLLIVAPMRMGGSPFGISFGLFYDRHGWAALAIVLLSYVEPRSIRLGAVWRDGIVLSSVLLFMVYSAINFAAVALAFMVVNALVSRFNRRIALIGLSSVAAILLLTQLSGGYSTAYFRDVIYAIHTNPIADLGFLRMAQAVRGNEAILTTCLLSLVAIHFSGRRNVFDAAFILGAVSVALVLTTQSGAIARGLPGLVAVFVCFGELASRRESGSELVARTTYGQRHRASLSILGLMLIFVSEPILANAYALFEYYNKTTVQVVTAAPGLPQRLSGLLVLPAASPSVHDILGHDDAQHVLLAELRRKASAENLNSDLRAADYLSTINEGAALLGGVARANQSVVVFDMTDPFSVALGLKPTIYGYPLFWVGPAFSEAIHPSPERFFSNADFTMVPVLPYTQAELDLLLDIYGPYLEANFDEIKMSPHWHLWARKIPVGGG